VTFEQTQPIETVAAQPMPVRPPMPAAGKRPRRWPWVVGIVASLFVGVGIGSSGSGSASDTTSAQPQPLPTPSAVVKTVTVPAPAASPATVVKTVTKTVTAAAPAPAAPAAPAAGATIAGDGTFLVGSDVRPGTYKSPTPDSGNCYWARLSGSDSINGIIANNNSAGPSVVTIRKTDRMFESTGCNEWTRVG
jgi:hypothetical protein